MAAADMSPTFSGTVSDQYANHTESLRYWVRQQVTRHHLLPVLQTCQEAQSTDKLQVLDFGGGNAQDALWLAGLGHHVTVLDISAHEITKGKIARADALAEVARRVTLMHGGSKKLANYPERFDIALSHGVLQYALKEPELQLSAIARALKRGGRLSLLTSGLSSTTAEKHLVHDQDAVHELQTTGLYVNNLGIKVRAYDFEQLEDMVLQCGFSAVEATFGVRIHSNQDSRNLAVVNMAERRQILEDEIAASENPDLKDIGSMLHLIVAKP